WLEAAVAGGFDLDTQRLPFFFRQIRDGGSARRKGLQSRVVNSRVLKGGQMAPSCAFEAALEAHQARDRLGWRHPGQRLDFIRGSAESGPFQQMSRKIV